MATAQLLHVGQSLNTAEETALIPSRVITEQQSTALAKRLLAISVSCITYLRGLFPESSYGTRYLDDMCLKILREDRSCQGSLQIVKWIRGCFDALEKNYLHMAVLAIFTNPKEPERLTELYRFKFKYSQNGPQMDFASTQVNFANGPNSEDVKKASILLIRKLYVLMQNLGPLPNDITLTMKLFYYNDVTPNEYQPPGFKEGSAPDCLVFNGDPVNLKVGTVSTGFHVLKVRVTTESKRMGMLESSLAEGDDSTEISHQGLDCDEEEEEGSTKTEEQNKLQATDVKLDKSRTYKGDAAPGSKDILPLNPKGKETTGKSGVEGAERGPLSKTARQFPALHDEKCFHQRRNPPANSACPHPHNCHSITRKTCRLDLVHSQEEIDGLLKKRKVSKPVNLISGSQKRRPPEVE